MEQTFTVKIGDRYVPVHGFLHKGLIISTEDIIGADGTVLAETNMPIKNPAAYEGLSPIERKKALDIYEGYKKIIKQGLLKRGRRIDLLAIKRKIEASGHASLSEGEKAELRLVDEQFDVLKGLRRTSIKRPDTRLPLEYRLWKGDLCVGEAERAQALAQLENKIEAGTAANLGYINQIRTIFSNTDKRGVLEPSPLPSDGFDDFIRRYTSTLVDGPIHQMLVGSWDDPETGRKTRLNPLDLAMFIKARAKWTREDFTTTLLRLDKHYGKLPKGVNVDLWLRLLRKQMRREPYDPEKDLANVLHAADKIEAYFVGSQLPREDMARTQENPFTISPERLLQMANAERIEYPALRLATQKQAELLANMGNIWRTPNGDPSLTPERLGKDTMIAAIAIMSRDEKAETDFLTAAFEAPIDLTDVGLPGYQVIKRPKNDPRLLFDGKYAASCINLGGAGHNIASATVTDKRAAALTIIEASTGRVVGHLAASKSSPDNNGNYGVGFVAWTGTDTRVNAQREKVMQAIAERIKEKTPQVDRVTIGISGFFGTARMFDGPEAIGPDRVVPFPAPEPGANDTDVQVVIRKWAPKGPAGPA